MESDMKKLGIYIYKHLLQKSGGGIGLMLILGLTACSSQTHNSDVVTAGSACADTLFINGKVRTVSGSEDQNDDDRFVAVRGNKILAVLESNDIDKYSCDNTKTIDLNGKTLMPGFVEPHTHPDLAGQLGQWVDISGITGCGGNGCKDWQQVKEVLEKAVLEVNEGLEKANIEEKEKRWVYAFGYDPILTPDLDDLSIFDTSAIAPDNPMLIMLQSMHTVYANNKAMALSGVNEYVWGKDHKNSSPRQPQAGKIILFTEETKDSAQKVCIAGPNNLTKDECEELSRDINVGDPTGRFEEAGAVHLIMEEAIEPSVQKIKVDNKNEQMVSGISEIIEEYGSVGITTVGVPGMDKEDASVLKDSLNDSSGHSEWLRTFWYSNPENKPVPELNSELDTGKPEIFERLGTKFWNDGSPYSASMLISEPYLDTVLMKNLGAKKQPWSGEANYGEGRLLELLTEAHNEKWQLSVHSQGDRSSEDVIEAIKKVLDNYPVEDPRPRLEHLALINEEQVKEAVEAGILLNFHILHLYYYGEALRDKMIGEDRARRLMPIKWALDAGSKFALHTDAPMYPPNPLLTVRTAVTRLMKISGQKLGSMQAIPVDDAIKAITINAAYQLKMEDYIGSIEVGKYADFVILKEDPYEVAAPNLDEIKVCETYVNGMVKYQNNELNGDCI